jgi:triosephosphate isomerase
MKTKTKLVIANWKMNPETEAEALEVLLSMKKGIKGLKGVRVIVCPPFVFLGDTEKALSESKVFSVGVQDVFIGQGTAHTGEIGIDMVKESGVKYVIVGHSERRALGDTEDIVKEKLVGVLKNDLKAILCVGEKERDEHGGYFHEIKNQLIKELGGIQKKFAKNIIVAYEPIWAIGKTDAEALNPEKLRETAVFIKRVLNDIFGSVESGKISIVYGGSVGKKNAKELVVGGDVDGLLVGRSSLKADNFIEIVKEIGG